MLKINFNCFLISNNYISMYFYLMLLVYFFFLHGNVKKQPKSLLDSILKKLSLSGNIDPSILQEAFAEPTAVLNLYGYPGENHSVSTGDGYTLSIYRIPNKNPDAIPILLMHGIACSSSQFFINQHTSPAFILADAGFDVWVGNFRDNSHTSHNKYTTKDTEFWDYSWQEMAEQDLPHTIDYVLNVTRHSKLILTGHSMGTTVGFALLSAQPSYNSKVAGLFTLAPVAFIQYMTPLPRIFLPIVNLFNAIKPRPLTRLNGWKLNFVIHFCTSKTFSQLCNYFLASIDGYDPYLSDQTRKPILFSVCQHGSSSKNYFHFLQSLSNKGMAKYDYGKKMNLQLYNSPTPPAYNLSKISAPVVIFYGANDAVADPLDVELFSRKLPNLKAKELVPWPLFAHSDSMWAVNMKKLVYDKFILHAKDIWKNTN